MSNNTREEITDVIRSEEYYTLRNRLLRANFLVNEISIFDDEHERILSPEEIGEVGKLPPEAPSILDIKTAAQNEGFLVEDPHSHPSPNDV